MSAFITLSCNCSSWQKIVNSRHYLCRCSGLDRDAPPPVILNIGSLSLQGAEGQNPGPDKLGNASGVKQPCCHWPNLPGRCWTAWKPKVNMESMVSMLTIHWGSLETYDLKISLLWFENMVVASSLTFSLSYLHTLSYHTAEFHHGTSLRTAERAYHKSQIKCFCGVYSTAVLWHLCNP